MAATLTLIHMDIPWPTQAERQSLDFLYMGTSEVKCFLAEHTLGHV